MSGYIVGLSGLLIDGAKCVVGPAGRIVAAVEEERQSRPKHASIRSSSAATSSATADQHLDLHCELL